MSVCGRALSPAFWAMEYNFDEQDIDRVVPESLFYLAFASIGFELSLVLDFPSQVTYSRLFGLARCVEFFSLGNHWWWWLMLWGCAHCVSFLCYNLTCLKAANTSLFCFFLWNSTLHILVRLRYSDLSWVVNICSYVVNHGSCRWLVFLFFRFFVPAFYDSQIFLRDVPAGKLVCIYNTL